MSAQLQVVLVIHRVAVNPSVFSMLKYISTWHPGCGTGERSYVHLNLRKLEGAWKHS